MRISRILTGLCFVLGLSMGLHAKAAADVESFLGRWALHLPGGAGWLEVRQENGFLDADILWRGGSVVPVSDVFMHGDKLIVTRSRDKEWETDEGMRTQVITSWLELEVFGEQLAGKYYEPSPSGRSVNETKFLGEKIPPLPPTPDLSSIKYEKPVKLFDGKDLSNWELVNPHAKSAWKVEDGVLINDPVQKEGQHIHYGNLRTKEEFQDFNLTLEVNVPAGSNSGVYLKGIYEVQVMDSYGHPLDNHNMGAIYSRIQPVKGAEKPAGEWQKMDITLYKRHVTVILNGERIIDNQPLYGVTGGALTADEFSPGPIYLQGDHGKVSYRNIVLKPIL